MLRLSCLVALLLGCGDQPYVIDAGRASDLTLATDATFDALAVVDGALVDAGGPIDQAIVDTAVADAASDLTLACAAQRDGSVDALSADQANATCLDGVQNRDESDVDCGGTFCFPCYNGKQCQLGGDCASTTCVCGVCQATAGLAEPIAHRAGTEPFGFNLFDWNGDGKLDVAVANEKSNELSVLLGDGAGGLLAPANYPMDPSARGLGNNPYTLARADFNGDGKPDLVSANYGSNDISLFLGKGDGTFQPATTTAANRGPVDVATGDFNHDGKIDVAVVNIPSATVSVLLGGGDGSFVLQGSPYPTGLFPYSVAAADLDRNGTLDLAVGDNGSDDVAVLLGNTDGSFAPYVSYPSASGTLQVALADLDGDGALDLVASNSHARNLSTFRGRGDGTFDSPRFHAAGLYPERIAVVDLDGDGRLDLVVGDYLSDTVAVLLGSGGGLFASARFYQAGPEPTAVAAGDFNGDGKPDLVVGNYTPSAVQVLINKF